MTSVRRARMRGQSCTQARTSAKTRCSASTRAVRRSWSSRRSRLREVGEGGLGKPGERGGVVLGEVLLRDAGIEHVRETRRDGLRGLSETLADAAENAGLLRPTDVELDIRHGILPCGGRFA